MYKVQILILLFVSIFVANNAYSQELRLTKPMGSEIAFPNDTLLIEWEKDNFEPVDIEFSSDGGETWSMIKENAPGYQYVWKPIPDIESEKCKIRITQKVEENKPLVFPLGSHIREPLITFDSKYLIIFSYQSFDIYDIETNVMINSIYVEGITSYSLSNNKNLIAISYISGRVETRTIPDGIIQYRWETEKTLFRGISFGRTDDEVVVSGWYDSGIYILNLKERSIIKTVSIEGQVAFLSVSPHKKYLYVYYEASSEGRLIKIDTKDYSIIDNRRAYPSLPKYHKWSSDGKYLLSIGLDREISVFSIFDLDNSLFNIPYYPKSYVIASCWSSDTKFLAVSNLDSTIRIYDTENWELQHTHFHKGALINSMVWTKNNEIHYIDENSRIYALNVNTYELTSPYHYNGYNSNRNYFNNDRTKFFSLSNGYTVKIWDVKDNKRPLRTLKIDASHGIYNWDHFNNPDGYFDCFWHPNDELIVFFYDDDFYFINSETGELIYKIQLNDYFDLDYINFIRFNFSWNSDGTKLLFSHSFDQINEESYFYNN